MKIVIDGNIGSGKTTQLNLLESKGFNIHREPIEKWPLELFYSDTRRWGLTFQLIVLETFQEFSEVEGVHIHERCPLSSKEVFWSNLEKTREEDHVYNWAYDHHGWGPDVYIFLNKDPKLCMQHIQTRDQSGDGGVSLDLLENLNGHYQRMFDGLDCPKFMVDASDTPEKIHENIVAIINDVSTSQL